MLIYEKVHAAVCAALIKIGVSAELSSVGALHERRTSDATVIDRRCKENLCFANPVRADVLSEGHKVAGAAQRRTRRGLLQQGSIQNVELESGFADSFAQALCAHCRQKRPDPALLARAEEIAAQRYGTPSWLR